MLKTIHHIQLAMPSNFEDQARYFYGEILGLSEIPKPPELAKHGGAWFERGYLRVHLGVEEPFLPARKAHPAFEVDDLQALYERLNTTNLPLKPDTDLLGYNRFYTEDPFGNRIEFLETN